MAQLAEQSFLTPEIRSLNPVIGKIYAEHLFTAKCIERRQKEKVIGPFLKKVFL